MKRSKIVALVILTFVIFCCCSASATVRQEGNLYVVDEAEGYAPVLNGNKNTAREDAKREAYRDALEKALGAAITGVTEMENYAVLRDKVFSQTTGVVKAFDITREWIDDDGVMHITAICKVAKTALDGVLGPAVLDAIGNPRMMVLIDERIADKTPFLSTTESKVLEIFQKAGYLIVDPDQARTLIKIDSSKAFDTPDLIMDAARTLRADVIILGKAYGNAFHTGKIEGITMYGVKGTVQLKAVLTKSAYQVTSKTVESSTGKKPALSVEDGAVRCFEEAASIASKEIVHNIAYSLASGSSGGVPGITVNIKVVNISFKESEAFVEALREFVGKNASVYERSYSDSLLEMDVVSEKTSRNLASFLTNKGFDIDVMTTQTITAKVHQDEVSIDDAPESPKEPIVEPHVESNAEEPRKSGGVCASGFGSFYSLALFISIILLRGSQEKLNKKKR